MFDGRNGRDGSYDVKKHAEEMARLFGPFPRRLLDRGGSKIVARCFHHDGTVIDPEREGTVMLENWVANIDGVEKAAYIAFRRIVMIIDLEKRKTPKELVDELVA